MYEHMFFKANEQLPAPDAVHASAPSELGAMFNGTHDARSTSTTT